MTIDLDPKTTALILIDLQNGLAGMATAPYSVAQVVEQSAALAARFREAGATIVFVRVDMADFLQLVVDAPSRTAGSPTPPASASEFIPAAGKQASDMVITKRHWSAFAGTKLAEELRLRGIHTVVMTGVATNIGVESTAREAAGYGFNIVFVEDAMSSQSAEAHRFAVETIFPRLGRVRKASELVVCRT